jgi:hypothetical protein
MALSDAPINLPFRGRNRFWYWYLSELETIRAAGVGPLWVPIGGAVSINNTDISAAYGALDDTSCQFVDATNNPFGNIHPQSVITVSGFTNTENNGTFYTIEPCYPYSINVVPVAGFETEAAGDSITITKANNMPTVSVSTSKTEESPVSDSVSLTVPDIIPTLAVTTEVGYKFTYDGNGNTSGTVPTDANYYAIDDTVTCATNSGTLAKTGKTFDGWNTAADGSGTSYAVSAEFTMA